MGDAERIMEMPRTQSYHEPRGPYYTRPWHIFMVEWLMSTSTYDIIIKIYFKVLYFCKGGLLNGGIRVKTKFGIKYSRTK